MPILSEEADRILTEAVRRCSLNGVRIGLFHTGDAERIAVWVYPTVLYDDPDGLGDTFSEAVDDAIFHIKNRGKL